MKDRLKKIMYKEIKIRKCKRPRNQKCYTKCFRCIGDERIEIKPDNKDFTDLCSEMVKKEEKEFEEFFCDAMGNEIDELGNIVPRNQVLKK